MSLQYWFFLDSLLNKNVLTNDEMNILMRNKINDKILHIKKTYVRLITMGNINIFSFLKSAAD